MEKKITASDVANFFLVAQEDPDETGEGISNMKMQKLCYYAQGFHLARKEVRLFDSDLEAWLHGPVVPELYEKYREYGCNPVPVPLPEDFSFKSIPKSIRDFLEDIYRVYGRYSAWRLRDMTHQEPPWANAKARQKKIISDRDMVNFFRTQLEYLD